LTACGQTESISNRKVIALTALGFIEIRNHFNLADTIQTVRKGLSNEQAKLITDYLFLQLDFLLLWKLKPFFEETAAASKSAK